MEMKKGVSMISLMIIVIIVFILLATSIAYMGSAVDNSRLSAFANDLIDIEDAVRTYYAQHDSFPTFDTENTPLSKAEIINLVPDGKTYFEEELNLNGDNVSDENLGAFYKIDLSKIGVSASTRGIKSNSDESDIYVVSYPSMNVYYVKGIEAKSKFYFSLSSNITSIVKLNKTSSSGITDYTSIETSQGITSRRENRKWTNKVNMYIDTYMDSGESLYIKIGNGTDNLVKTIQGQNKIYFQDDFKSYNNITEDRKYNLESSSLENDIEQFNLLSQKDKKVTVTKKISGNIVATLQVDFSNYEVDLPVKTQAALIVSKEEYNLFTIKMQDYNSGIKEVRYEYLTKYDENANVVNYYKDISRYDEAYMRSRAKVAKLSSDGVVEIQVPKNISSIQLAAIDNAGNISQKDGSTYIFEDTSTYVYIGIEEISVTRNSASINFAMKSIGEIKSAVCSISVDGINFANERNIALNKESSSIYKSSLTYENLTGIKDRIYVRVEAVYLDTNKKEIRIKEIPLTNNSMYATSTNIISPAPGNNLTIAIPAGFTPVTLNSDGSIKEYIKSENWNNSYFNDAKINEGVVIVDKYGNEFVWIPIENVANYTKRLGEYPKDTTITSVNDERNYPLKYGGFYVGRYESAFSYNNGNIGVAVKKSNNYTLDNWSTTRNASYDGYLWNYISYEEAKNYSRRMVLNYGYYGVNTDLINGVQWDSVMYFLSQNGYNVTNSTSWGNHGLGTFESPNAKDLYISGSNIMYSSKNIYDLAGNLSEYTNEHPNNFTNKVVIRGGSFLYKGDLVPVSYRYFEDINNKTFKDVGFRVVMCFE